MFLKLNRCYYLIILTMIIGNNAWCVEPAFEPDPNCVKSKQLSEESVKKRNSDRKAALQLAKEAHKLASDNNCTEMKALALKNIGAVYFLIGSYDLALTHYQEALLLYESIGHQTGISACNHNIAYVYEKQSDFAGARHHYQKSLAIDQALGDLVGVAATLNSISFLYFYEGQYNQAVDLMLQALRLNRQMNDREGEADCLSNLGSVLETQQRYNEAFEKYQEAMAIALELNDEHRIALLNYNMGVIKLGQGKIEDALALFTEALLQKMELDDKASISSCFSNIGTCLQQLGQVEKAIDYYLQALKIDQELGNYRGVATQLTQIGGYLLLKNEPLQALNYLNKSQELAHRYNYKEIVRDNYQQLVAINMALLNYEMAYESLQKYSALRDSMTLDTLVINQLSGLSQTSLSEQVKKQTTGLLKWRNLLIISLLANIVFAIIFIYRRRRKVAR